jgi:hypothetical protein
MSESVLVTPITCRICGKAFEMKPPKIGDSLEKRQSEFIGNVLQKHFMVKHTEVAQQIFMAGSMYAGYLTVGQLQFTDLDLVKRVQEVRKHILASCMPLTISDEMIQKRIDDIFESTGVDSLIRGTYYDTEDPRIQLIALVKEVRDVLMGAQAPPVADQVLNGDHTPA